MRWPLYSLQDLDSVILITPKWVRAQNYYVQWGNLVICGFLSLDYGRGKNHIMDISDKLMEICYIENIEKWKIA